MKTYLPFIFVCIIACFFVAIGHEVLAYGAFMGAGVYLAVISLKLSEDEAESLYQNFSRQIAAIDARLVSQPNTARDLETLHKLILNVDARLTELDSRVSKNDPFGG